MFAIVTTPGGPWIRVCQTRRALDLWLAYYRKHYPTSTFHGFPVKSAGGVLQPA